MNFSDPTASRAVGSVNREWTRMVALAYQYRTDPKVFDQLQTQETVFRGIYQRLLTDPIAELEAELFGKRRSRGKGNR